MYQTKLPKMIDPGQAAINYTAQEAWRVFGIMAEFVAATERLANIRPAVTIWGSARVKPGHPYYQMTEQLARLLSDSGFAVISGGGPGLMEAANRGAYFGKSPSVGLNIALPHEQIANQFQDISQNFHYFFSRKVMFVRFATAFVATPGGFGTLDELMECLTLVQTGKARRIPIILMGSAFWGGLLSWFREHLVAEGMINAEDLDLVQVLDEPQAIVDAIFRYYETRGFQPTKAERDMMLNL